MPCGARSSRWMLLAVANLHSATPMYVYLVLCGAGLLSRCKRAPLAAWPVALGSLAHRVLLLASRRP